MEAISGMKFYAKVTAETGTASKQQMSGCWWRHTDPEPSAPLPGHLPSAQPLVGPSALLQGSAQQRCKNCHWVFKPSFTAINFRISGSFVKN